MSTWREIFEQMMDAERVREENPELTFIDYPDILSNAPPLPPLTAEDIVGVQPMMNTNTPATSGMAFHYDMEAGLETPAMSAMQVDFNRIRFETPEAIANELVGVQPINTEAGLVFNRTWNVRAVQPDKKMTEEEKYFDRLGIDNEIEI